MKKFILLAAIPLLLLVGAFVTLQDAAADGTEAPVVAAEAVPPAQQPVEQPGDSLELEPMDGSCSASFDCDDGTTVQCTGSSTCKVLSNGVECDGNQTLCQGNGGSCTASTFCTNCSEGISCFSSTGDCEVVEGSYVRCDGNYTTCVGVCGPERPPGP